ncbi:MAG: DinB family protein [Candidatus Heimdallarchaeaceae archaeon]
MLKNAVSRIEGDYWKKKENNWMYGYVLFHTIEAIDYYLSESAEEWKPLNDVSNYSEEKETEALKTKDKHFFEEYLRKIEEKTFETLEKLSDEKLLEKDGFGKKGFTSRLHKYIYLIRHCMVHLGELSKTLRDKGEENIKWE